MGVETALVAVAKAVALGEAKKRIADFLDRGTKNLRAARAEMAEDWALEARALASKVADESANQFAELGGRADEIESILERALGDAPVLLCAIYEEEAAREAMAERRLMLAHAAACIGDLAVAFEDKCRVERSLRSLFPRDVLGLDQLHRLVGDVARLPAGMARNYPSEGAYRAAVLHASRSASPLLIAGCAYERVNDRNKWGEAAFNEVTVTPVGELLLHVLRSFLATRRLPAPGRGHIDGERGEVEARRQLGPAFFDAVYRACVRTRGFEVDTYTPVHLRPHRIQFSIPRPTNTPLESAEHKLKEVRPDAEAKLHIWPVAVDIASTVPTPEPPLTMVRAPIDGKPGFVNVMISGPFDVLRWLAEEVGAWWT